MHPCEPFRSGAPHAYFDAPQGAPCAKVEERWLTPLQLPSVYHNPSCDGCARDAEENRMQKKNLVDKT